MILGIDVQKILLLILFCICFVKIFDSISINELTKKANINRSTFYSHYEDKNHLLKTVIKTSLHNYLEIHTINNFLFGEEFIWSILVQTRDFVESISKEWGQRFFIHNYANRYVYTRISL